MSNIYWDSFRTFFKIGAVTFGGGYAMIPIIETEVVDRHKWVNKEELLDLIAIAQSTPGVFAVNISTFIGYKLRGTKGAICATAGAALPSFLIILLIAMFFHNFRSNPWVEHFFCGVRPAVVALIAAPCFKMAKTANITWRTLWVPVLCCLLIVPLHISPIWLIVIAGVSGFIYGKAKLRKK